MATKKKRRYKLRSWSYISVLGKVIDEPKVITSKTGRHFVSFTVVIVGKRVSEGQLIQLTAFDEMANRVLETVKKGNWVAAFGTNLMLMNWAGEDGVRHTIVKAILIDLEIAQEETMADKIGEKIELKEEEEEANGWDNFETLM